MKENKDAQYREEFIVIANEKEISPVNEIYRELYIAGRKKGEEEIEIHANLCIVERFELQKEIIEMKKEIEELRLKNKHNLSIDLSSYTELCRINSDYDKENKKLRSLIEVAKVIMTATIPEWRDYREKWLKEAEEVLK